MSDVLLPPAQNTDGASKEAPEANKLVDHIVVHHPSTVVESTETGKPKKVIVRGEFARADAPTENGRIYGRKLWEREIQRLEDDLKNRKVLGEVDHPESGRTAVKRVSHVITKLSMNEDGIVMGEAEIFDTEYGKDLKSILLAGGKVGVSSRGYGSVEKNGKGQDVVQDDYKLVTFDFVAEPADSKAYPDVFLESKGKKMAEKAAVKEDKIMKGEPKSENTERLRDDLQQKILQAAAELRPEITESVRKELLEDPAVAGAVSVVNQLVQLLKPYGLEESSESVLSEKDTEIQALKDQLAEAQQKITSLEEDLTRVAAKAKNAGFSFFIEKSLSGNPDYDLVKNLLGDVNDYGSLSDLKVKLESVTSELSARREKELTEQAERRRAQEKHEKELEDLRAEAAMREEKLLRAIQLQTEALEEMKTREYAAEKLRGNPSAGKLRPILESAKVKGKKEVDALLESLEPNTDDASTQDAIRANVRKLTRGGRSSTPRDEERPLTEARQRDYNGLGISLDDMLTLSGIDKK